MPTRQQIHIDKPLTNISVAFMQEADAFIADKVFPIVGVQKQSDTYFQYKKEDFFRDDAQERAKGTESAGGDYDIEQAPPYFCRKYAYHEDVTEDDVVNADTPLQPKQDATENVSHKLLLKREIMWASKYFQSGIWATDITGVDSGATAGQTIKWDKATSDPIRVIKAEATKMVENTGKKPNTLVLSPYAYNALIEHEDVIDRIKYTQKGIATKDLLAQLFEVENVYVPWAIKNSAAKGDTAAMSFVMGKNALLCYVEKKPGLKKASAGYIFAWRGLMGAGAFGNRVVRIPMPWLGMDTERIEGEMAFDMGVVAKDLGTFFVGIVD